MTSIAVGVSTLADTHAAAMEALTRATLEGTTAAVFVTCTEDHDAGRVYATLRAALGETPILGVTTSLGVLTAQGVVNDGAGAIGVMAFGHVCSVGSSRRAGAAGAGEALIALRAVGRVPSMIFCATTPGEEEDVLAAVAEAFPGVPCQGGSAADHAIAGQWSVFLSDGASPTGVALLALWDARIGSALLSPYTPLPERATVTAVASERTLVSLGGQSAAKVLGQWLGGAIDHEVVGGGNILAQTALHPIGIVRQTGERKHIVTVHPAAIHDGQVDVFARVAVGDEICSMTGSVDALVASLPALYDVALQQGRLEANEVAAAFLVFCAGCAAAAGPVLDRVLQTWNSKSGNVPMFGICSFGEQGFVPGVGSLHQDLTLTLTLIAK